MEQEQAMMAAVKAGDAAGVRALLGTDARLAAARDEQGVSAVLTAIYYGQPAIAQALMDSGLALDMFEAAATGRSARVAALLEGDGMLVNRYAADGFTALGLAAFFGHSATVELLLARGADPNAAAHNNSRVAPLHSAAAANDPLARQAVAAALLAHGAEVNARQEGGFTPLHAAAQNGDVELARLLLGHGADPHLANDEGLSSIALARRQGFTALAEVLQSTAAA